MRSNIVRALTKLSFIETKSAVKRHESHLPCAGSQKHTVGHTPLLAVLVDQFDNLRTEGHAGAVELLNFLVICEIIFRGVQSTQHGQQPIDVGCL